ncbi:MAG: SDR family NAD(P)-dependent oxidoreductase [Spirochaetaceae bacterium]
METLNTTRRNETTFDYPCTHRVDLGGMNVLIFGGAGNLGEAFAYAAACCGARVAIADVAPQDRASRDPFLAHVEQIAANVTDLTGGTPPPVFLGSVTDYAEAERIVQAAEQALGSIEVGIDCAGVHHRPFDLLADDPEDLAADFRRVNEINLTGAFIVTTALARAMAPRRSGHIIHLCSNGSRASLYGSYAYNAAKHGLEGLVKTAAAQLAPFGVRVNGIAPGTVETNLNRDLLREPDGTLKPRAKSILAHTPSKRFASREGVAASLVSMCVPQPHLTGNVIFADDGYNIEGHSWPEGNAALFEDRIDELYEKLSVEYPEAPPRY